MSKVLQFRRRISLEPEVANYADLLREWLTTKNKVVVNDYLKFSVITVRLSLKYCISSSCLMYCIWNCIISFLGLNGLICTARS